jgi:outer membrane immunogenic protein
MKKMLLAGTALIALVSGSAMAADMRPAPAPAPVYTKAPMMAPLFTWTGCYIGGNGGGLWAKKDVTGVTSLVSESLDLSSWAAGGQIGCNYQVSAFVFGIQGDYDWSNASASVTDTVFVTTDSVKIKSVASATGRVGYAMDRFLFYVKGGGAWEADSYSAVSVPLATSLSGSETRTGWTAGVGGEYAFLDWLTGFVEYDYYDFGTKAVSLSGVVLGIPATVAVNVKETKSVAKAGINFKFGGWH